MSALGRPPGAILIESLRGGPKDVDPETAALGYRDAAFNVSVMASWTDPARDDEHIAWARETAAAIEPWSVSGGYANYMQADEPLDRVRAALRRRTHSLASRPSSPATTRTTSSIGTKTSRPCPERGTVVRELDLPDPPRLLGKEPECELLA